MPQIVADRFVRSTCAWIDIGTGCAVRLRIRPAGSAAEQLAWNTWCATLANLRHPLINPLIDYGSIDRNQLFEAYASSPALRVSGKSVDRLIAHAMRFLSAHGVTLGRADLDVMLRSIERGRSPCARPIGVALQHRPVHSAIEDVLQADWPLGPCVVSIEASRKSGLRTTRLLAVRAARLQGYVPVDAGIFQELSWLAEYLTERHVCVFVESDLTRSNRLGSLFTRLDSARRHVVLVFGRPGMHRGQRWVSLERMGVTAMTGMVFADREQGPAPHEILNAARAADGRPGVCLERLGGDLYEPIRSTRLVVHETPQSYGDSEPAAQRSSRCVDERRLDGVLRRSIARGESLVLHGRHVSARRVLTRATRVLLGRGALNAAAEASLRLGSLSLDRGLVEAAAHAFEQARTATRDSLIATRAAIGLGLTWTEQGRLVEAEAVLRAAMVAASGEDEIRSNAVCALARCLYWMGRLDEATLTLDASPTTDRQADSPRLMALRARIQLANGQIPSSVRTAHRAVELASEPQHRRILASAYRILAAAVASGGDERAAAVHIQQGRAAAAAARLPLAAARLRLTALDIQSAPDRDDARRIVSRVIARNYPPLPQAFARAVLARIEGTDLDPRTKAFIAASGAELLARPSLAALANPVADLESFLDLSHTAPDDGSAIERIAASLQSKLRATTVLVVAIAPDRRVLTVSGRPWHGDPHVAWRAAGAAVGVPVEPSLEPCQAAEPVRYCGDVIGAVATRWTAGVPVDPTRAASLLRVASVAMAPNVRALLDRSAIAGATHVSDDLLGESAAARTLRETIARAARAPFPVLIQGESGSGKELVARAIHRLGARRERRFCALNCAALSDELIEAELFGHTRGAFTGASGERAGLFEEADGGTLFLDEIGELSARAQAKLLRVLQDGEVRRVGENLSRRVDVRIIAATNRRLDQEAAAGRFRADLRFRLDVVRIEVPPLRDRASDVPMLASRFWDEAAGRVGTRATLSPDAVAALSRYEWPGNVRELQNVIAWMAVQSPRRGRIGSAALPAHVAHAGTPTGTTFEEARQEFERRFVKAALASADGQRARAAEALGITRQGLAKMMRRLGLDRGK
jgi:DNA-binding NtrC family response regulator/predicted negative regulator of RcsB-dependent stress response